MVHTHVTVQGLSIFSKTSTSVASSSNPGPHCASGEGIAWAISRAEMKAHIRTDFMMDRKRLGVVNVGGFLVLIEMKYEESLAIL